MQKFSFAYKTTAQPLAMDKLSEIATENHDNLLVQTQSTTIYYKDKLVVNKFVQTDATRIAVYDGVNSLRKSRELTEQAIEATCLWPKQDSPTALRNKVLDLNQLLRQQFNHHSTTAASAMTLVELIGNNEAIINHVGDTRLVEISNSDVRWLTIDASESNQSLIVEANETGHLNSSNDNRLLNALGWGNSYNHIIKQGTANSDLVYITHKQLPKVLKTLEDSRRLTLNPNHYYLLCTDGFIAGGEQFIKQWPAICHHPNTSINEKLEQLFSLLRQSLITTKTHYADNATAILFRTE